MVYRVKDIKVTQAMPVFLQVGKVSLLMSRIANEHREPCIELVNSAKHVDVCFTTFNDHNPQQIFRMYTKLSKHELYVFYVLTLKCNQKAKLKTYNDSNKTDVQD